MSAPSAGLETQKSRMDLNAKSKADLREQQVPEHVLVLPKEEQQQHIPEDLIEFPLPDKLGAIDEQLNGVHQFKVRR
jgi:hypothetical protein